VPVVKQPVSAAVDLGAEDILDFALTLDLDGTAVEQRRNCDRQQVADQGLCARLAHRGMPGACVRCQSRTTVVQTWHRTTGSLCRSPCGDSPGRRGLRTMTECGPTTPAAHLGASR
jgi:hypothetical protein